MFHADLMLTNGEACGLGPSMQRFREVAGSFPYYSLYDQPAPSVLSYCVALLPAHPYRIYKTFRLPWGVCDGFAAVLLWE